MDVDMAEKKEKSGNKEEKKAAVKAEADDEKKAAGLKEAKEETKKEKPKKEKGKKAKTGKDPWNVLVYPHLAEKSMNMVEFDNKLTFVVKKSASKENIKEAIEDLFEVKVLKVQTEITPKGVKKAYAKLSPENSASEIASRLGMV
jgi:large subunit ribosomal protein L23